MTVWEVRRPGFELEFWGCVFEVAEVVEGFVGGVVVLLGSGGAGGDVVGRKDYAR